MMSVSARRGAHAPSATLVHKISDCFSLGSFYSKFEAQLDGAHVEVQSSLVTD